MARRATGRGAALGLAALLLAGCSAAPDAVNPVSWWHGLEGGAIASGRPPPPGAKEPFPMLAAAPARPAGMPDWEWKELTATLAAQRGSAQGYADANPIPTLAAAPGPARPGAAMGAISPVQTAIGTTGTETGGASTRSGGSTADAFAADPGARSAAAVGAPSPAKGGAAPNPAAPDADPLAAMNFDVATPKPGANAPRRQTLPTQSGVTSGGFFAPTNEPSIPGALDAQVNPDEAALPTMPASLPVPPSVPGFAIAATPHTYVPAILPPQPAPYVSPAPLPPVPPVLVGFKPHSAVVSILMAKALRSLANHRKTARIGVTGFGDASGGSIADQAAVMPLAIERARAIEVRLLALGVKPALIETEARAMGTGGLARLIH